MALAITGDDEDGSATEDDGRRVWQELPPLGGAATLGRPKPAALVLATDENERPLLVAHEAGRGRCLIAAWESTWPWALASDTGHTVHQELWRQMVIWLANRRPRAWVLTDQPQYAEAALASGEVAVEINAGISGLDLALGNAPDATVQAAMTLRPADQAKQPDAAMSIKLERRGDTWVARLPDLAGQTQAPTAGTYVLEFFARVIRQTPGVDAAQAAALEQEFTARTRFSVLVELLEQRAPNANLPLLHAAAERTGGCGGRYVKLAELPGLLQDLADKDQRQRVATPVRHDLVASDPWGLLAWLVLLLGVEWAVRKRCGLA